MAGLELAYLEVFDDAELGMPLGFLGIAVLWVGCLVSIVRSRRPPGSRIFAPRGDTQAVNGDAL